MRLKRRSTLSRATSRRKRLWLQRNDRVTSEWSKCHENVLLLVKPIAFLINSLEYDLYVFYRRRFFGLIFIKRSSERACNILTFWYKDTHTRTNKHARTYAHTTCSIESWHSGALSRNVHSAILWEFYKKKTYLV